MGSIEILDELPKLSAEEIDAFNFQAAALRQHAVTTSPELQAAIDEADVSFATDSGKSIEQIESEVKSWLTE